MSMTVLQHTLSSTDQAMGPTGDIAHNPFDKVTDHFRVQHKLLR